MIWTQKVVIVETICIVLLQVGPGCSLEGVLEPHQAGCRTVEHCTWIAKAGQWGCVDDTTIKEMAGWRAIPVQGRLGGRFTHAKSGR